MIKLRTAVKGGLPCVVKVTSQSKGNIAWGQEELTSIVDSLALVQPQSIVPMQCADTSKVAA